MEEKDNLQLPENAFRELKDGEEYKPLMSPDKVYPEVNGWSGNRDGSHLLCRRSLSGLEGGSGVRSSHPNRHHRRGRKYRYQA